MSGELAFSMIAKHGIEDPDSIAVYDDGLVLSYADLEASANRLAHYLKYNQVGPGDIVALYMRRSFDIFVVMQAVWKVGATYVCLDVETPSSRLDNIIAQCQPKCIVTEPAFLSELPENFPILTCQDPELNHYESVYHSREKINEKQAAYLVFTSGSTGLPKGVMVSHHNLANYVFWFNKKFQITSDDIFSFNSSPAFDFAITCMQAPLTAGAKVFVTRELDTLNIATYCSQLEQNCVTFAKWTPSYFKIVLTYVEKYKPDLSHLRYLMIAGEELLTAYLARWFAIYPSHTIINEYGPTETTVGIATQVITASSLSQDLKTVPVGYPIQNTQFYVVNANAQQLSQGEVGELWIGGDSVALGYHALPTVTKTRFIKNPFRGESGYLYKTGDLVKQLPDNSYLYVGRIDRQVKINGYRVEISEVEHWLLTLPEIEHACVVVVSERKSQSRYLEAYIVLKAPELLLDQVELNMKLSQHLPQCMLPKNYHVISSIPLTSNGKIDYCALKMPIQPLEVTEDVK